MSRRRWFAAGGLATGALAGFFLLQEGIDAPDGRPEAGADVDRAVRVPLALGSVRFAVLGDVGRGDALQYETAAELARWHERVRFDSVLLLGDTIYGPGTAEDLILRFDRPYAALLERDVTFHAVIGNHDPPAILTYAPLGLNGRRYYSFVKTGGPPWQRTHVLFVGLDTVRLDRGQLAWLRQQLAIARADWTIAFYHHPLYTSGSYWWRAGVTRRLLEPLFVSGGVDVGFNGHEHFYERVVPQRGIQYFTSGAGGALRVGALGRSRLVAAGFDRDTHFILVEIVGDRLHYQTVSRTGHTVDHGVVAKSPEEHDSPRLTR